MAHSSFPKVAVLLATYNGSRCIWDQLRSLADNIIPFELYWLDDHSTDTTRDAVRLCASRTRITLRECHHHDHLGLPHSFFRLLETVEADIYLFCDQDDIWQPGKLDYTAQSLASDVSRPVLAFTDMLIFHDHDPAKFIRLHDFSSKGRLANSVRDGRTFAFMPGTPSGQTQGFTRPLRDLFLRHADIARAYAAMHDWWMYDIAIGAGRVVMLPEAPKVLYRTHGGSYCQTLFRAPGWQKNRMLRQLSARHARGLLLAADTLPQGPQLDRMRHFAGLVARLDQRQSAVPAIRLARLGIMSMTSKTSMVLNCICTDATA